MRNNLILIIALLLTRFAVFGDGRFSTYLFCAFLPFMILIIILTNDLHETRREYHHELLEEQSDLATVLGKIYGWNITESYIKRFTPFVESISIKMNMRGSHSIHAAPVI